MKAKGHHQYNCLNKARITSIKQPGRHLDGGGLYLLVEPSGAKRWLLRLVANGRRRDIGLGSISLVSLAEARDEAAQLRRIARKGGDPVAERQKVSLAVPTFEEAARRVHEEYLSVCKNEKHRAQWIRTLEVYAFPSLACRRLDQIETPDVLKVLSPIWLTKPETARRVKQRILTVLDWAKSAGHRQGENPVAAVAKGLPKQTDTKQHHAAIAYMDLPSFLQKLHACEASNYSKLALEFLILTATRSSEVLNMRWEEIDIAGRLWIIPGVRMKAGREHRVPLSNRCLEILETVGMESEKRGLIFCGRKKERCLSNMVFLMILRRMNLSYTVHGFRSSFRDWAAERTNFTNEVCEMALAHVIANKVEAAYRRGDLLEKRRKLMEAWSSFLQAEAFRLVRLRAG